jgi:curved DNA-binding protein CbpA
MTARGSKPDLYGVLGVDKAAGPDAIKKAYRGKAKKAHPDAGGKPEEFQPISQAYLILSDPRRRQKYDQTGEVDDSADNADQMPLMILTEMMEQVIAQSEIDASIDIVAKMRDCLDVRGREVEQKLTQLRKDAKRLEKLAERFHSKTERNFLRSVLMKKVAQTNSAIAEGEDVARHMKAAKDILKDYSFDVDQAARPRWQEMHFVFAQNTMFTGGTTA